MHFCQSCFPLKKGMFYLNHNFAKLKSPEDTLFSIFLSQDIALFISHHIILQIFVQRSNPETRNEPAHEKGLLQFSGLWIFKGACSGPYLGYRYAFFLPEAFARSLLYVCNQQRIWWDCAYTQTCLSLSWLPVIPFSHVLAQILILTNNISSVLFKGIRHTL